MEGFGWNHEWDMNNILLGAAAHWSSSGVKWILALDEHCGPTLPDVTFTNGRPLVAIPSWASSEQDIQYNQDYYSIKHMSKFLTPQKTSPSDKPTTSASVVSPQSSDKAEGSTVRVGTVVQPIGGADVHTLLLESFYNAENNLVTVIAMNRDHSHDARIQVTQGEDVHFSDTLPGFSTKVYQWTK